MSNLNPFHIRKATVTDAVVLAQIGSTTFYDTFRPYNTEEDMQLYLNKTYQPSVVKENLSNPSVHYYLCLVDEKVVGYIKLIHNNTYEHLAGKTIELEKIYVLQSHFGTEAGKLLMQQAIMHSRLNQFDILFLGVWKENTRAVRFYEKTGFTIFSTRFFKLGERLCEDYMMKLVL